MSVQLRFATPNDAAVILRLIQALAEYEKEPDAVLVDEATLRSQLASDSPPFECLLAEHSREVIGFALFFHTYSTWRGRRGIFLEDLFVIPEHRRKGAGTLLLQRLAALALERDCARLEWSVLNWNKPSIVFYEQLGAVPLNEWTSYRVSDAALRRLAGVKDSA